MTDKMECMHPNSFVFFLHICVSFFFVSTVATTRREPENVLPKGSACMSLGSCASSGEALSKAITEENFAEACRLTKISYDCMKEGVTECKNHGDYTEQELTSMEQAYKSLEPMLKQYCEDSASQCLKKCEPDLQTQERILKLMSNAKTEEACSLIKPIHECAMSTFEKCKEIPFITKKTIDKLNEMASHFEAEVKKHCPLGSACMSLGSCASSGEALSKAITVENFAEACRLTKISYDCMKEGVTECKNHGKYSEQELTSMEQAYKSLEPMLKQYCEDTASQCLKKCEPDLQTQERIRKLVSNAKTEEACSLIKPIHECAMSTSEKCKEFPSITKKTIDKLNDMVSHFEREVNKHCPSGSVAVRTQPFQNILLMTIPFITFFLCKIQS